MGVDDRDRGWSSVSKNQSGTRVWNGKERKREVSRLGNLVERK